MKDKFLSTYAMAGRIFEREENAVYKKEMIYDILKMYVEEIRKALIKGERVRLTGVGTIIPEVKTHHRQYYIPTCRDLQNDSPYTKIRITRNDAFVQDMNQALVKNMEKGIWGLENLRFDMQQMNILKAGGFIPEDAGEEDTKD